MRLRPTGKSPQRLRHPATIGKITRVARFLLKTFDNDFRADMQKPRPITSRLLIVAALALPPFALLGCKSTPPSAAPVAGQPATDDATLAARVKQALAADPQLRSLPVSVATYRGVVQVAGYVESDAQIERALAVARSVPGVRSVSNELHLRPR